VESDKENFLKLKEEILFKTYLFDSQRQFLESNQNRSREIDVEQIEKSKENLKKKEDLSKFSIIGFLNLMENYRRNVNFDMGSSISKKIVRLYLNILIRLMKLQSIKFWNIPKFFMKEETILNLKLSSLIFSDFHSKTKRIYPK
jgi:hypothetical protein